VISISGRSPRPSPTGVGSYGEMDRFKYEPTPFAIAHTRPSHEAFCRNHPVGDGFQGVRPAHRPQGWAPTGKWIASSANPPRGRLRTHGQVMKNFVGTHPVGDGFQGVRPAHRPQGWAPTGKWIASSANPPRGRLRTHGQVMKHFVGAHPVGDGFQGVCPAHRPQGWAPTATWSPFCRRLTSSGSRCTPQALAHKRCWSWL
jgi:hypothetical protein